LAYNSEEALAGEMITVAFEESLGASRAIPHVPPQTSFRTPSVKVTGGRLPPASATYSARSDDNVRRTLQLDQSFGSADHSRLYEQEADANGSSLEFSDDSSMNIDE
jgi:hypothetical protein